MSFYMCLWLVEWGIHFLNKNRFSFFKIAVGQFTIQKKLIEVYGKVILKQRTYLKSKCHEYYLWILSVTKV